MLSYASMRKACVIMLFFLIVFKLVVKMLALIFIHASMFLDMCNAYLGVFLSRVYSLKIWPVEVLVNNLC